ncbi:heparinase II/III domain-containing protein [Chitinophaga rhizophila]|uniref:Heparinase II/III-family protein n=1 Tax=Chitinophaga rhizophila TaxID=2866212 RepID=A0ABS7GAA9_9BACT|nr:heparinase II/III family protein [Chitinophaga rhizophila]MBW8684596.1 heparinase II/III-family protein [Chitinophaga rhizophila]
MKYVLVLLLLVSFSTMPRYANAQEPRNLLSRFSRQQIAAALLPAGEWRPFPTDAAGWKKIIPDSVQQSIFRQAESYLKIPFVAIPASMMMEYQKNGDRSRYEEMLFRKRDQLFTMAVAEAIERKGRFLTAIINGIWSICEESFWGTPGHLYLQKAGIDLADVEDPSVDLFASETATVLALTDYLLGPQLDAYSKLLRKRIYHEVNRRLLTPLEKDSDRYFYLKKGTREYPINNWNPWVISNWMTSLLLLEKSNDRRISELEHALHLLDHYINFIGEDGAVDEGPVYWSGATGRVFDALTILESATGGKLKIYNAPIISRMASYIYKMHIAGNYYINVADASPVIPTDGLLLFRMGQLMGDPVMKDFGAWAFHRYPVYTPINGDFAKPRMLFNMLAWKECARSEGREPVLPDVWLENIQLMAARADNGLFVASHGGHNGESHNHNDVGDFIVYASGQPVIIDVGLGTYTAKTFSKDRYQLWYNSSAYHNLPTINNVQQKEGRKFGAGNVQYHKDENGATLRMDIAGAYPQEAGVSRWVRAVQMDRRQGQIIITDDFTLASPASSLTQTFMTVCPVDISQKGVIQFNVPGAKPVRLSYEPQLWEVKTTVMECKGADERRLTDNWSRKPITRILLISRQSSTNRKFVISY